MEQNSVSKSPEVGDVGALINEKERLTYDQAAKNVLSNKVIVANILSGVVTEFKGKTADEIRPFLKSGVNDAKVACLPTDDAHSDMATLSFDINMHIENKEVPLDIEIDIEPQGKLYPNYKGRKYSIYTRGMIYGCRMLDRQLPKYDNDYSKIHKCYSIWICFQKDGSSYVPITRYRMKREAGEFEINSGLSEHEEKKARQYLERADGDMDLLEVIMIYVPKSYDKALYDIQKLLYSVFNKEPEGIKPFLTPEEQDMIESEVDNMGRLEAELKDLYLKQGLEKGLEQGLEKGLEQGLEKGKYQEKVDTVKKLVEDKIFSFDNALKFAGITMETYNKYNKPVQPGERNTGAASL